jgi:hypothetical protein
VHVFEAQGDRKREARMVWQCIVRSRSSSRRQPADGGSATSKRRSARSFIAWARSETLAVGSADDGGADATVFEKGLWLRTGDVAIEPDQEQDGMPDEVGRQAAQRITDLRVRRHDPHAQWIALGVDPQHPLSAFDLLVGVPRSRRWLAGRQAPPRGPCCGPEHFHLTRVHSRSCEGSGGTRRARAC